MQRFDIGLDGLEVEAVHLRKGLNMGREVGKELTPSVAWVLGPVDSKARDVWVPAAVTSTDSVAMVVS